jgi:hypothetical protein
METPFIHQVHAALGVVDVDPDGKTAKGTSVWVRANLLPGPGRTPNPAGWTAVYEVEYIRKAASGSC